MFEGHGTELGGERTHPVGMDIADPRRSGLHIGSRLSAITPSRDCSLVLMHSWWRISMRSHHVKSTIGHLGLSRSILRCFDMHDFKSNRFRCRVSGRKTVPRCCRLDSNRQTGMPWQSQRAANDRRNPLRVKSLLPSRQVEHTTALGKPWHLGRVECH